MIMAFLAPHTRLELMAAMLGSASESCQTAAARGKGTTEFPGRRHEMAEIPRLNGVVKALAAGQRAFTTFTVADTDAALALSVAKYDGIVYEMEHNPWD